MRSIVLIFILVSTALQIGLSQCNTSNRTGIHVVQPGENLYRIALQYGVKLNQLCAWNNIKIDQTLASCKELKTTAPSSYAKLTTYQPSEFEAKGASQYSTTTSPATSITRMKLTPSSANELPPAISLPTNKPSFTKPTVTSTTTRAAQKQSGKRHTVQYGETMASIAAAYGFTENRLREINVMRAEEGVNVGSILLNSDCACDVLAGNTIHLSGNNTKSNYSKTVPSEYSSKGQSTSTHSQTSSTKSNHSTSSPSSSSSFMKSNEQSMIDEINLLRSNPGAYTQYVRDYLAKSKTGKGFPTDETIVNELISELNSLSPLSRLEPTECIYNAARKHGIDQLSRGKTGHVGTDGSYPWDRVIKECPALREGGENLIGGPSDVRDAVIMLLIDKGIPNRGHRKTLLNKDWKYLACYKVGKVGMMPNCWVQKFGY